MNADHEIKLRAFCDDVMRSLELTHEVPLETLAKHTLWLAQEQSKAFAHGASVEEFCLWAARQLVSGSLMENLEAKRRGLH